VWDVSFLLCFNAYHEDLDFVLPPEEYGERWHVALDTHAPMLGDAEDRSSKADEKVAVAARSLLVLKRIV